MDWNKLKTWILQHWEILAIIGLPLLIVLIAYLYKYRKLAQLEVKNGNVKAS
jgi:uncharacterized membrane protein